MLLFECVTDIVNVCERRSRVWSGQEGNYTLRIGNLAFAGTYSLAVTILGQPVPGAATQLVVQPATVSAVASSAVGSAVGIDFDNASGIDIPPATVFVNSNLTVCISPCFAGPLQKIDFDS